MDRDREALIDTIQRLLALSQSPNEHEAQAALAKAQELMLRHNLSIEAVTAAEVNRGSWTEELVWQGRRPPYEQNFVANILQEFFFVRVIYSRWQSGHSVTELFGAPENVAVSRHAFVYLSRVFRNLWQDYRTRTCAGRAAARTFYCGLRDGFRDRLRAERNCQTAGNDSRQALTVVSEAIDVALAQRHGDLAPRKPSTIAPFASAYFDGRAAGAEIRLQRAVDGQHQPSLLESGK